MDIFSERFLQIKKQKKLTYQEIAAALNLKVRTIQYYASGQIKPDYAGLVQLADYLDVSLDYLTGRLDSDYWQKRHRRGDPRL